jgi:hypothetical protein
MAHAGALLALAVVRLPAPSVASSPGTTAVDLDLSLPEPARPRAPASLSAASAPLAPSEIAPRLGRVAAKVDPAPPLAEASLLPPPETSLPAPDPASSAWSFSPLVVAPIDLRAAVTPDAVAPRATPSDQPQRPPTASTTGGLSEGLAEHDVGVGLGHGGAVLSAAEAAARSADAPVDGSATFDVVVRADGSVVASVVHAEGDASGWARVASGIGRSVDRGRMHLPEGRAWHVVVCVDAKVRLPDGREVKSLHGPRAGVTESVLQHGLEREPGTGSWAEGPGGQTGAGDEDTVPMGGALGHGHGPQGNAGGAAAQALAQRILPVPRVSVSGKVCTAALGVSPAGISLSGGCSPENIGGHGTRVVSGRVVSEGAL